jgi:hypothetical protein
VAAQAWPWLFIFFNWVNCFFLNDEVPAVAIPCRDEIMINRIYAKAETVRYF